MEVGEKFVQAATCFLFAALKQVPGLGAAVEVWDNVNHGFQSMEQKEKIQSLEERLLQLESASKLTSQEARGIAVRTIEDLRQQGEVISEEKAQAIEDIISVMPSNIAHKTCSSVVSLKNKVASEYIALPLGIDAMEEDRMSFYKSLIPSRRPKWQKSSEFKDRWYFEDLLGMGGFGEVWRVKHKSLAKYQAVKFCLDEKSSKILKREEHIIASLPNHKNIVNVLDSNIEQEPYWIAFEYVDGGTLEKHILNFGQSMPLQEVIRLMSEICSGLSCAHKIPLVHRDLKPANILMTQDHTPKIADFGLSKIMAESIHNVPSNTLQMSMRNYGTWTWMSPEQREGLPAHPSDDVYAWDFSYGQ